MNHRFVLFLAVLTACGPQDVSLRGRVYDNIGEKSRVLPGASVRVINGLGGPEGDTTANANGRFSVNVGGGQRIYAVIEADGYVPSSFTGSSGSDSILRVPNQTLFAVPEATVDLRLLRFDGCPGLYDGGVVIGEVRVNNLTDELTGENPLVQTAMVEWVQSTAEQQVIQACYLDEEGAQYDPEATRTGPSGLYVIPNVPQGLGVLAVRYEVLVGAEQTEVNYDAYMPEDGVVARFPTWVEFETPIQ